MAERKKRGPTPKPERKWTASIQARCHPDWKCWFDEFVATQETESAEVIRRAIAAYAKSLGFREPPER